LKAPPAAAPAFEYLAGAEVAREGVHRIEGECAHKGEQLCRDHDCRWKGGNAVGKDTLNGAWNAVTLILIVPSLCGGFLRNWRVASHD